MAEGSRTLVFKANVGDPETFETFLAGESRSVGDGEGEISEEQAARLLARHGGSGAVEEGEEVATEAAVKEAEKSGVDLTEVEGSGSGGKVTASDVKKAKK